jgi:ribosomal protein S13
MAVRTRLSWRWRTVIGVALVAVVAGMWWWGFDFGQIFGDFNRKEQNAKLMSLEVEANQLRVETARLRARSSLLESELAIAQGSQTALSKQVMELQIENSQLKDELAFLQSLVADSNKQLGLSIQRLAAVRDHDDMFHFSMLVVRGGSTSTNFEGNLKLQAAIFQPAIEAGTPARSTALALPDEQPDVASALELKFKYYQRVEGSFRVPPGAVLRSLTARAFEAGQAKPRATQNLNFP